MEPLSWMRLLRIDVVHLRSSSVYEISIMVVLKLCFETLLFCLIPFSMSLDVPLYRPFQPIGTLRCECLSVVDSLAFQGVEYKPRLELSRIGKW
jgi:hypothetical protein